METKQEVLIKTPISYYGGKQTMLKHILPLLPEHEIYVEPFFGGGAVFWAKQPATVEVINDFNGMVVNFYEQLKLNFDTLKKLVDATPYSRQVYQRALVVYKNPYLFTPEVKAWAFWVATNQVFSIQIGSWRGGLIFGKTVERNNNKKLLLTKELEVRISHTIIECLDAVEIIKRTDTPATFFYIDPPYVGADQAHYGGYTQEHFNALLAALEQIKGRFLLSSYPNDVLNDYCERCGWSKCEIDRHNASSRKKKQQTECLTRNY
jgi:DNA adenine methylase